MDACETLFVVTTLPSNAIVRWLRVWAGGSAPPTPGDGVVGWAAAPEDETAPGVYEPSAYETVALYLAPAGLPLDGAALALSITFWPLHQRCWVLELRRWPPLPVALGTVAAHLSEFFADAPPIVPSAAPPRTTPGAPPLACNSWLEAQLRALPRRASTRPLYAPWLEQYRAVRGVYPAEPQRSFRAAVDGCRRRIREQRGLRC